MKYVELNNGRKMPIVGYGMWQCESPEQLSTALNQALDAGYRHFDTAYYYGNEAMFGKVLKEWFTSGKVKREDLFITTKLPLHGNHHERLEKFLKKQLESLQLDYIDLYLIHNPASIKADGWDILFENGEVVPDPTTTLEQVWKKMEEQVAAGRVKSIGISNYSKDQIERIVKCANIIPANHQIEANASYPKKPLREFCAKHGITVCAFAPLGSPGRKAYYKANRSDDLHLKVSVPNLLNDPIVTGIAKKHTKTPAQVLLRFLTQQNVIVIPKSVTSSRIKENIDIFDFDLDSEDMRKLDTLRIDDEGSWGFDWTTGGLPGLQKHPEFKLAIKQL